MRRRHEKRRVTITLDAFVHDQIKKELPTGRLLSTCINGFIRELLDPRHNAEMREERIKAYIRGGMF